MTTRKRSKTVRKVIVALQGEKVLSEEKTGIAPLSWACNYATKPDDEIVVLTFLSVGGSGPSSSTGYHGENKCKSCNHTYENDHFSFLRQHVSERKEDYRRIFRPFYERCKCNGVKFLVKIAAGIPPKDIITYEANNVAPTWILMDSSLAKYLTFRLTGIECNVSLISDIGGAMFNNPLIAKDETESSMLMYGTQNPKSPKLMKGSTSQGEPFICHRPSTSREIEQEMISELLKENEISGDVENSGISTSNVLHGARVSEADFMVEKPQQISWEEILQITKWFTARALNDQDKNYSTYIGEFNNQFLFVKRLAANSSGILEAEMKVASSMHHKNIMVLSGYHYSENGTILAFPLPQGLTLDKYIWGSERRELNFQARLKMAIGIAQGVRYMHEECPQGPVVHGELQPCNIFLGRNLQPMISGFGKAKWLQYKQISSNSKKSHKSMEKVKGDVLSFGVLLLRLFCRRSAPKDDKSLIAWARPLMLERKFHEILEEGLDFLDVYGIYKVMAAATACTRTKPISRPYMTQVIYLLKGEQLCDMQMSPSDSSM